MRVREWMSPDPVTVAPSTSVDEARHLLDTYGVRHLPVVDHGRVVGMISDRDVRLAHRALATAPADREQVDVAAVMSTPVHVVDADAEIEQAARLMLSRRISALPVLDNGELVGLVTTTDCLLASLTPVVDQQQAEWAI